MAAETQTAMQRLYAQFWKEEWTGAGVSGGTQSEAIAKSLLHLAETLDRKLTPAAIQTYLACLAELTKEEIILAFSRAAQECRFFPPPAILREFSGRAADGDPIAREAKEQLLYILDGMRSKHGPMLKPILGRVLYGTEEEPRDEDGRCAVAPIRAESTPFPLARRTQAALVRLGWGDSTKGIAVIADHPALLRNGQALENVESQYKVNQLRAADEILRRFTDAYREV